MSAQTLENLAMTFRPHLDVGDSRLMASVIGDFYHMKIEILRNATVAALRSAANAPSDERENANKVLKILRTALAFRLSLDD